MAVINVWCDGSIEGGNPGGHGVSGYIIEGEGLSLEGVKDLGKHPTMTNNISEYEAVVAALTRLRDEAVEAELITIHCDSKLVVEQCSDNWNCNNDRLRALRDTVWSLCDAFPDSEIVFKWIPREENSRADEVSRSLY